MTKNELNDAYFNWMYQLVFDGRYSKKLSYQKLLRELHRIEFTYSIPMDGNRAEDGVDLRYRFGYENGYSSSMVSAYLDNRTCSVLERKYSRNGDGGLFTVNHSRYDLRSVEIWYQMCWYLDENT